MNSPLTPIRRDLLATTAAPPARLSADLSARFAAVDTWIFDLDNTLYSATTSVWPAINARITLYVATMFGLDGSSARALQKYYYQRYGTTLRGLMIEDAVGVDDFLAFVHDVDRTTLAADPVLGQALIGLPGRKLIFTNGSHDHALRTAEQLGFAAAFDGIFDIVAAELVPKPEAVTYDRFIAAHGVDPIRAVMFEDISRNLVVPHARGMLTVLVVPKAADAGQREDWELEGAADPWVDCVTDDLAGFLSALARAG